MGLVEYVESPDGSSPPPHASQPGQAGRSGSAISRSKEGGTSEQIARVKDASEKPAQQVKTEEVDGEDVRETAAVDRRLGKVADGRSRSSTLTDSAPVSPRAARERNFRDSGVQSNQSEHRHQPRSSTSPEELGECSHLALVVGSDGTRRLGDKDGLELEMVVDRYQKGIQWGRRIKRGKVKQDADEDELPNGVSDDEWRDHDEERRRLKRRKVSRKFQLRVRSAHDVHSQERMWSCEALDAPQSLPP